MKKGIELSLNFLVIIIIALVIFGFGIRFIYKLTSEADKLGSVTTEELDEKIGNLFCQNAEKVCMPISKKTIQKGKFGVMGIKITNILDKKQDFSIQINPSSPAGYTKNNDAIQPSEINKENKIKLKYRQSPISIEKNGEEIIGIGIEIPKNAKSGTYIFNVDVGYGTESYGETNKFYVEVP
ncbi:hypothetical protein HYX01_04855 [Candidatus Woesearchaeota archaeon]|nr:hypothetical protein [Candidatus Woesearchaeota archaeon]